MTPILSSVPRALWNPTKKDDLKNKNFLKESESTISKAFTGFVVKFGVEPPHCTTRFPLNRLIYQRNFDYPVPLYIKPEAIKKQDQFKQSESISVMKTTLNEKEKQQTDLFNLLKSLEPQIFSRTPNLKVLKEKLEDDYFIGRPILSYLGEEKKAA